jgi:hypothetical protein
MSKIINEVFLHNEYAEIKVTRTGLSSYVGTVLVDIEDLNKISKIRITNTGYAYLCGNGGKSVAHIVMNHQSNMDTVVDHINHNKLDNRKYNLRILAQAQNANNRGTSRNNTGTVGISLRENGKYQYYRATISDRKTNVKSSAKSQTKRYSKQFNINKMGKEEAFIAAKSWLYEKRKEFGYF